MIVYLYGPDSYRRRQKLNWYLNKFREKHSGLTIGNFDLTVNEDLSKLKDFSTSQSLFVKAKLGILDNVSEYDGKELAPILKSILETKEITLIISEDKKLTKEFDFLLKQSFAVEVFEEPASAEILSFIKKEATSRKLTLDRSVAENLLAIHGSNLWGIVTDLDKLALGGKLEEHFERGNFFDLLMKVKRVGEARHRLPALETLLNFEDPAKVFNMIASQADVIQKRQMADYDSAIKSGKFDYEEALLELVISH